VKSQRTPSVRFEQQLLVAGFLHRYLSRWKF